MGAKGDLNILVAIVDIIGELAAASLIISFIALIR